jgi:hypothetical protein
MAAAKDHSIEEQPHQQKEEKPAPPIGTSLRVTKSNGALGYKFAFKNTREPIKDSTVKFFHLWVVVFFLK